MIFSRIFAHVPYHARLCCELTKFPRLFILMYLRGKTKLWYVYTSRKINIRFPRNAENCSNSVLAILRATRAPGP